MRVWCVAVRWGVALAAVLVPVWASAQPILSVTPTAVDLQASVGTNPPSQTVTVSNAGSRALKWSVVPPSVNWVSVAPTSGVNTGTVTLTFNMALPLLQCGNSWKEMRYLRLNRDGRRLFVALHIRLLPQRLKRRRNMRAIRLAHGCVKNH